MYPCKHVGSTFESLALKADDNTRNDRHVLRLNCPTALTLPPAFAKLVYHKSEPPQSKSFVLFGILSIFPAVAQFVGRSRKMNHKGHEGARGVSHRKVFLRA